MIPNPEDMVLRDDAGLTFAASLWDGARDSGVLVVHGLLGTRSMREIRHFAEALAVAHDVLTIDVRGHGDSPGRFTWGREEWRQVEAAARALAEPGRDVAAVGFSFGGFHVVRAAARGAAIGCIVTVGAPCDLRVFDHFPFGPKLWRHLPAFARRRRRRLHAELPPLWAGSAISDDELARICVPALVVHGEGDWLVSARHAKRYAAGVGLAQRLDVPGGFHGEYMVDSDGDLLVEAIAAFLARRGRPVKRP